MPSEKQLLDYQADMRVYNQTLFNNTHNQNLISEYQEDNQELMRKKERLEQVCETLKQKKEEYAQLIEPLVKMIDDPRFSCSEEMAVDLDRKGVVLAGHKYKGTKTSDNVLTPIKKMIENIQDEIADNNYKISLCKSRILLVETPIYPI